MALSPAYVSTPKIGSIVLSTANPNRDGTGTVGIVFTAGTSGSRVDYVSIAATGNTTLGMVRLFIHDGTNYRLLSEVQVNPITPSATTAAFNTTIELGGVVILPTGHSLRAATEKAETFHVIAFGGDF